MSILAGSAVFRVRSEISPVFPAPFARRSAHYHEGRSGGPIRRTVDRSPCCEFKGRRRVTDHFIDLAGPGSWAGLGRALTRGTDRLRRPAPETELAKADGRPAEKAKVRQPFLDQCARPRLPARTATAGPISPVVRRGQGREGQVPDRATLQSIANQGGTPEQVRYEDGKLLNVPAGGPTRSVTVRRETRQPIRARPSATSSSATSGSWPGSRTWRGSAT